MRILMLSADQRILEAGSEARRRMIDYGSLAEELHIIVKNQKPKIKNQKFGNIQVYPTNTWLKPLYFFDFYRIGRKIIHNSKFAIHDSVITAQDPFEIGLAGYLLKKKFGLSLQIQIHTDFLSPYFWRESFKNKIRVLLAKLLITKANSIRVVSERIKKSLVISYKSLVNKIAVLPIFVDIQKIRQMPSVAEFRQRYAGYEKIVLMVSRLTREKNIALALRAFKLVVKERPRALLLIVGSGPEKENIELRIGNYGLEKNVIIEPWTDNLVPYYKAADIYLLTSRYEGYGRTAIEAAAAGLPVVMTDVGVAIGKVVPGGDAEALGGALIDVIEDQSLREELLELEKRIFERWPAYKEYLQGIRAGWDKCLMDARRMPRLLFITQKVDLDDDLLGVYHEWINRLAERLQSIAVICLYKGKVALPENVKVYSLGKERVSDNEPQIIKRLIYAVNFYKYIWQLRNGYDAVFVHMNPEYVILGGFLWKILDKRLIFWYAHYLGTFKLRIAAFLANRIVTSTRLAYPFESKKLLVLQQGIDTSRFKPSGIRNQESGIRNFRILFLGRIAPVKHLEVLLEAFAAVLKTNPDISLTVVGSPTPGKEIKYQYFEGIKRMIKDLNISNRVSFRAAVAHGETPDIYRTHDLFVNLTDTGSFDKTTLEAMACGLTVIVSNRAFLTIFTDALKEQLMFEEKSAEDLARKIRGFLSLGTAERVNISQELRSLITHNHSLSGLTEKLSQAIKNTHL